MARIFGNPIFLTVVIGIVAVVVITIIVVKLITDKYKADEKAKADNTIQIGRAHV